MGEKNGPSQPHRPRLDLARRNEPVLASVSVNTLIDDLALLTRHKCRGQNVEMERRLDPLTPSLLGDPTLLEQAFLNVTLNALEAMPEGGRLRIRTRALPIGRGPSAPTHVLIRFRDTGVGMAEDHRNRAFSSLLSTTRPKGTGLGLALVARVVEAHEGQVNIWSRPGRGTAITMVIPASRGELSRVDRWRNLSRAIWKAGRQERKAGVNMGRGVTLRGPRRSECSDGRRNFGAWCEGTRNPHRQPTRGGSARWRFHPSSVVTRWKAVSCHRAPYVPEGGETMGR